MGSDFADTEYRSFDSYGTSYVIGGSASDALHMVETAPSPIVVLMGRADLGNAYEWAIQIKSSFGFSSVEAIQFYSSGSKILGFTNAPGALLSIDKDD